MHIVGFTGQAGAGKTTAARYVTQHAHMERMRGRVVAFADPLKALCGQMFPWLPTDAFRGAQEDKERPLELYPEWTGRRLMQYLGTDVFRQIDPDFWVKHFLRTVRELEADRYVDVLVVDDVRFPDELAALRGIGGRVYRLERPGIPTGSHASEALVRSLPVDGVIANDGAPIQLRDRVIDLLIGPVFPALGTPRATP